MRKNYSDGIRRVLVSVAFLLLGSAARAVDPVDYVDADGSVKTRTTYRIVTEETDVFENGKWYVVPKGADVRRGTIVVEGSVRLILCDDARLTVTGATYYAGIQTTNGTAIAIYAQKKGTGSLTAIGGLGGAGIGALVERNGGAVTINGGRVRAYGGEYAAGIGGLWTIEKADQGTLRLAKGVNLATGDTEKGLTFKVCGTGGKVRLEGERYYATGDEYYDPVVSLPINEKIKVVRKDLAGYTAPKLPTGLKFSSKSGTFTGTVKTAAVKTATFTKGAEKRRMTLQIGGVCKVKALKSGSGKVTPSSKTLAPGKKVTLKAAPSSGYVLSRWTLLRKTSAGYVETGILSREKECVYKVGKDAEQFVRATFISAKADVAPVIGSVVYVDRDGATRSYDTNRWYFATVGTKVELSVVAEAQSALTFSSGSLPDGLKIDAKTGVISGVTRIARNVYSTIKVKNASGKTAKIGIVFRVAPLPTWVTGVFDGYYALPDEEDSWPPKLLRGSAQFTVGKSGKVSGAVYTAGKKYVFEEKQLESRSSEYGDSYFFTATPKCGKKSLGTLTFEVGCYDDHGYVSTVYGSAKKIHAWQNLWKRADYGWAEDFPEITLKTRSGLKLKIAGPGVVTVGGKVKGDGGKAVSVSGSAQVVDDESCIIVYIAPKDGLKKGYVEFVRIVVDRGDDVLPVTVTERAPEG